MYKIFFTPTSEHDIQSIYDYIAEDNQFYAEDVLARIHYSIDFLQTFPLIGTSLKYDSRYIVEPKYRFKIVYRVRDMTIEILSVFKYQDNWKQF